MKQTLKRVSKDLASGNAAHGLKQLLLEDCKLQLLGITDSKRRMMCDFGADLFVRLCPGQLARDSYHPSLVRQLMEILPSFHANLLNG